jgi:NAD(P)-dependent dehydrogenase (short-subunit alcohol dehydrogenase family)
VLAGKVALVTGGDSGIGRAVAVLYAREGADVAIVYLREERSDAEETKAAVEAEGGCCLLIAGDVRKSSFCGKAVEQTVQELGRLDVLVNNAAFQQHQSSIEELTDDQITRTFETNIFGYMYMARAAVRVMKPGSAIINTGSITGLEGSPQLLDYSSTKGAIHAFTKSLAQSLVEKIRVNCVAPGSIWTPLNVSDKPADGRGAWRRYADGAARPTRGGRAVVRVFRLQRRFELHHRRGTDFARWRNNGCLARLGGLCGGPEAVVQGKAKGREG